MNRRIATFVLVACYGAVALLGPELHELLGCHHHEHIVECAWHGASGSPAEVSAGDADDEAGHDHDGCPICKLLSMAQTAGGANAPDWAAAAAPDRIEFSCGPLLAPPLSACHIRGPPSSAA
jgi:hypothetical protein